MSHQTVVADRQFCARAVDRVWSSVSLCVLSLETATGSWRMLRKTIEDRQTDGQIDGQSADVEKNKRGYADSRTDRLYVYRLYIGCR